MRIQHYLLAMALLLTSCFASAHPMQELGHHSGMNADCALMESSPGWANTRLIEADCNMYKQLELLSEPDKQVYEFSMSADCCSYGRSSSQLFDANSEVNWQSDLVFHSLIKEAVMKQEKADELKALMQKISTLLYEHGHPHMAVVITPTNGQVLEGVFGVVNKDLPPH